MAPNAIVPAREQVRAVLSENAAQVLDDAGRPAGVMVSSLPIATKSGTGSQSSWRLADIGWERKDGRIRVTRPVVPTSLPVTAGGQAQAGDVGVQLAPSTSEAPGTVSGETVTYPNVQTDTDMVVRSTPVGFVVGWTIRSPEATSELSTDLDLPSGVQLRKTDAGAIEMVDRNGVPYGGISAASGRDAAGEAVAIETTIEGSKVTYSVDHKEGETAYPVSVDPQYAIDWRSGTKAMSGWQYFTGPRARTLMDQVFGQANPNNSTNRSLGIYGLNNNKSAYDDFGSWYHFAPGNPAVGTLQNAVTGRMVSPEHATWTRFDADDVSYGWSGPQWYHGINRYKPRVGLLDRRGQVIPGQKWEQRIGSGPGSEQYGPTQNGYVSDLGQGTAGAGARIYIGANATTRPPTPVANSANDYSDNVIAVGLVNSHDNNALDKPFVVLTMGWYRAFATDYTKPNLTVTSSGSSAWTSSVPSSQVQMSATDNGTGVFRFELSKSSDPQNTIDSFELGCVATGAELCPYSSGNRTLSVGALPEGRNTFIARARDGGAEVATNDTLTYLIDRTKPKTTLSGPLSDNPVVALSGERALTILGEDNSPSGARAGVQRIRLLVDGTEKAVVNQQSPADSASLTTTWIAKGTELGDGLHLARIEVTDRAGNVDVSQLSFTVDASAPGVGAPTTPIVIGSDGLLVDLGGDLERNALGAVGGNGNLLVHEVDGPAAPERNAFNANDPAIDRWYNGFSGEIGGLGRGWLLSASPDVRLDGTNQSTITFRAPSGARIAFSKQPDNSYVSPEPDFWRLEKTSTGFIATQDDLGRSYTFDATGRLLETKNAVGAKQSYGYDLAGTLASISSDASKTRTLTHLGGRLRSTGMPFGAAGTYSYVGDNLTSVAQPAGANIAYEYNAQNQLAKRSVGSAETAVTYDAGRRVKTLTQDGSTATFTYATPQAQRCALDATATSETIVSVAKSGNTTTYAYCFDSRGQIVNAFGQPDMPDEDAPEIGLSPTADDSIAAWGAGPALLTVQGSDDGGLASVEVRDGNGAIVDSFLPNCASNCPVDVERQISIPTASMPEGMSTLTVTAKDTAGNQSEPFDYTLLVDHTPPPAVTDIVAGARSADGTVELSWDASDDPELSADVPGAGAAGEDYRVRRSGVWTPWIRANGGLTDTGSDAVVSATGSNEVIDVEVRAVDAAGNVSAVAEATFTAVEETPPTNAAARAPEIAQGGVCAVTGSYSNTSRNRSNVRIYLEEQDVHGAAVYLECFGVLDKSEAEVSGAFFVSTNGGTDPGDYERVQPFRDSRKKLSNSASPKRYTIRGFNYECVSEDIGKTNGRRNYKVSGHVKVAFDFAPDINFDYVTKNYPRTCPLRATYDARALSAFKALAMYSTNASDNQKRSPNRQLRNNLLPVPEGTPPNTPRAWAAHHLIPWNDRRATQQQILMFRCRIQPNSLANGLFLRASGLKRLRSDGKPNPKYEMLRKAKPKTAQRTYHADTTRNAYFNVLYSRFGASAPDACDSDARNRVIDRLIDLDRDLRLGATYGQPRN